MLSNDSTLSRALFALLAAFVLALGVAACGDDDDDEGDGGGETSGTADRVEPRQRRAGDHGRIEELHRAVHPRRDLRPGARGRRLRRQDRPQPRLRAGRAQGARGRRDQRLSRVHLDRTDLVLRPGAGGRPGDAARGRHAGAAEFEDEGLVAFAPAPFDSANAVGHAGDDGRRARGREDLRPRGPVPGPDPVRLARVPPAGRTAWSASRTATGSSSRSSRRSTSSSGTRCSTTGRPTSRSCSRPTRSCPASSDTT